MIKVKLPIKIKGWGGIFIWPFLFYDGGKKSDRFFNHEAIHSLQCSELLVVGFYLLYVFFIVKNLIKYKSWMKAYLMNPFEKEAYLHEKDTEYLIKRNNYNWINYIN